ncbi:hypothetical protein BJEO58_02911 [Brevibacterium jeotgali]|uniref:Uncharacterized protein n=1 Tax=Brevibacterium jeotgali TaxID=1262550 RepID=A0A2H1L904_9MICO|nr:hypothetical protein BJEO58_02911 [Brevibacterium jeotgali]
MRSHRMIREVLQVKGDNGVGAPRDRCGKHMSILRIALHIVNQLVEPVNKRFRSESVPHHSHAARRRPRVDMHFREVPLDLVQDRI